MALDFSQILVVGVSLKSSEHFNSFFFEFRESKPPLTKVFERGSKVINFGTVDNQKRSCDWLSSGRYRILRHHKIGLTPYLLDSFN